MNLRPTLFALALLGMGAIPALPAESWSQWRGPSFNGSSDERNLPVTFSQTEHVLWVADMPGPSAATPVIRDGSVFVSTTDKRTRTLQAMALDAGSGTVRWQQKVSEGYGQDDRANYAGPSPVCDDQRVVFYYGNGALAAFALDGKPLWATNVGPFAFLWTYSTSPLLFQGRLYLQILQRNGPVNGRGSRDGKNVSYLLALDPATGRELWRVVRPSEAREESLEAFTTPMPHTHAGRTEILVVGGDCLTGHDRETGRELWRWGTWNPGRIGHWRLVPSPLAGAGVALACAPKGGAVYAVKLGQQGTLDDSALAWKSTDREISSDVSTPLFYKGRFYVLNSDRRSLACLEAATGKVIWAGKLESRAKIEASPTGADDKIYAINHHGDVFVLAAGDEFKVLHTAAMGDENDKVVRSSIVPAGASLFIRTESKLYRVGRSH